MQGQPAEQREGKKPGPSPPQRQKEPALFTLWDLQKVQGLLETYLPLGGGGELFTKQLGLDLKPG